MTAQGEMHLQNDFQKQVEAVTGVPVPRWNHGMLPLKRHPDRPTEAVGHQQVLMQSDPSLGIVGLIEGIERVNQVAFTKLQQDWAGAAKGVLAGPGPSMAQIALAAAAKLARAWEAGPLNASRISEYRLMLAYGGDFVWEERRSVFGGDPRRLDGNDLPGWPQGLPPVAFRVAHDSEELPFLDLGLPGWVDADKRGQAVQNAQALMKSGQHNAYAWVREFSVDTPGGRSEAADFTLFMHGLPVLWVEMKIPARGVETAANDFLEKATYRGAPLRLLCNGKQAVLTALSEGSMEKWHVSTNPIGHGHGMPKGEGAGIQGGQAYLLGQVLTHPARFEFLIRRASSFNANGRFLVARPQQYQALARWWQDLLWSACAGQEIDDRLIRHTQRTGKTHTMGRAIRLALAARGTYHSAFDMALLMVGETDIIKQISTAFLQESAGLLDTAVVANLVESRKQFRKLLAAQRKAPGTKRVILANTQKLESLDSVDGKQLSRLLASSGMTKGATMDQRTLVVLDESHLSQNGGMADMRQMLLPGARNLLLTATPKTQMAQYYGIVRQDQILDDFGYRQAQEAELVVPVRFERAGNTLNPNPQLLQQLADVLGEGEALSASDLLDGAQDQVSGKQRREIVRAVVNRIESELIRPRLDAAVGKVEQIREALPKTNQGLPLFQPRSMIFCRDRQQAKQVIDFIQEQARQLAKTEGRVVLDQELNVYGGLRFGMDVSDFGHGDENTIGAYNPGVSTPGAIKARFESDDPDTRIDVLLAVGKYTKGYDNANLCLVLLFKTIREPSLINQIYTRPATQREGKASGVCLDLALGQGNVASWKASLALYDKEANLPLFDEAGVEQMRNTVRDRLDMAAAAIDPDWTHRELGDSTKLGPGIDRLKAANQAGHGQVGRFVMEANGMCTVIEQLPDAAVLAPLRAPLLGVKYILGQVRRLFPEFDTPHRSEGTGDGSIETISQETLGLRIDRALEVLNVSSLRQFLDLAQLSAEHVDGDMGSQALMELRTQTAAHNAIAAARALLGIQPARGSEEPDSHGALDEVDDPKMALRIALELALERLVSQTQHKGPDGARQRMKTHKAIMQVQSEIEKLRAAMPGGDFQALLTHELRQEFGRRWELLALPKEHEALFEPLIEEAGRGWASEFTQWRKRNEAETAGGDLVALAKQWIGADSNKAGLDLVRWVGATDKSQGGPWLDDFKRFSTVHAHLREALRSAMGKSEAHPATQDQASLLEVATLHAARKLALLEASAAWKGAIQRGA